MIHLLREFIYTTLNEASGEAQANKRDLVLKLADEIVNSLNEKEKRRVMYDPKTSEIHDVTDENRSNRDLKLGVLFDVSDITAKYDLPPLNIILATKGQPGTNVPQDMSPSNKALIVLAPSETPEQSFDRQMWPRDFSRWDEKVYESDPKSVVRHVTSLFRHELIHFVDSHKSSLFGKNEKAYNPEKVNKKIDKMNLDFTPGKYESPREYALRISKEREKADSVFGDWYYNHGIEVEAYVQQALIDIEQELADKGELFVPFYLGKRPEDLLQGVMKRLPKKFVEKMNNSTKRAVMKRVALAWKHLKTKYNQNT